jgi:hypothetical protein
MSRVAKQNYFSFHVMPSIQRLTVIQSPFRRLLRHQADNLLHWLVKPIEVFFDILSIADARPALFDVSDFTLRLRNKRHNVQLLIGRDWEDKEVPSFRQPCHAVGLVRPIFE